MIAMILVTSEFRNFCSHRRSKNGKKFPFFQRVIKIIQNNSGPLANVSQHAFKTNGKSKILRKVWLTFQEFDEILTLCVEISDTLRFLTKINHIFLIQRVKIAMLEQLLHSITFKNYQSQNDIVLLSAKTLRSPFCNLLIL